MDITAIMAEAFRRHPESAELISNDAYLQKQVDMANSDPGNLKGMDCAKCLNRGYIYAALGEEIIWRKCECLKTRADLERLKKSGLERLILENTFENYRTPQKWQEKALNTAKRFVDDCEDNWFFIGGQPGSGKTHLCSAIVSALMDKGMTARYMLWREDATHLKAIVNQGDDYAREISGLKSADVLYIDDLFKIQRGDPDKTQRKDYPAPKFAAITAGDINLAFEILNHRYNNRKTTIISTEHEADDITDIDEAIGSRVYQRSKKYCIVVPRDQNKNYRFGGE